MANSKADLLQGTLDLLILKALQHEPMHGFGVAVRIGQMSKDMLTVEQGSLYPALYRMEAHGWLSSEWGVTDTARRARFYKLTRQGRAQLEAETESWTRLTAAVQSVLGS